MDWENPEVIAINKIDAHASFRHYNDSDLDAEINKLNHYKSLNGLWKFHWVDRPSDRPKDFYLPDFDVSGWDEIEGTSISTFRVGTK